MRNRKKLMSNRTYRCIVIPVISVASVICLTATITTFNYSDAVDSYMGKGEKIVETIEGKENWDTDYYEIKASTAEEAQENGAKVSKEIADEGCVLLKNNGVLPLAEKSSVTPFGAAFIQFYPGGYGDSDPLPDYYVTPEDALNKNFTVNSNSVEAMKKSEMQVLKEAAGTNAASEGMMMGANRMFTSAIFEYEPGIYTGIEASCQDTTGIVFIGRGGNEGSDEKYDAYEDGTPHYLALSEREKETIAFAKDNCESVVAVINSSNVMELGELISGEYEVDAVLWTGLPGGKGFESMSDILCGKVNPSGRTVDIYPADFTKDPSYVNFGEFLYDNVEVVDPDSHEYVPRSFVEYEEGIYVGYRYYETAAEEGYINYDEAVVFPFGYGLSYTKFNQSLKSYDVGDTMEVVVTVTNTGDRAGKDTVQLYATSPYTDYDIKNGIEKASYVLCAFDKTKLLEPGESENITLKFDKEDLASYAYEHDNGDGTTGCYFLEEGDYTISLKNNSHDLIDSFTFTQDSNIFYDNSNPRQTEIDAQSEMDESGNLTGIPAKRAVDDSVEFIAATNQFAECNDYMNSGKVVNLSRADFENTFPSAPDEDDMMADEELVEAFADFDYETDPELGNVEGSKVYTDVEPDSNEDNGISASDLRGRDYYDPLWQDYLDQIDYSSDELKTLLFASNYLTSPLEELSLPGTTALDGPTALLQSFQRNAFCAYPTEVVLASTWNVELAYKMGDAISQECLTSGIQGWYAPAMNTHRTPFCGRNFEYYSEDPFLSGVMAIEAVSAAGNNGVYCEIKHFAMNEMETHRQYVSTWATEQAIREIYLKPFEKCIKEAKCEMKYISDTEGTVSTKIMKAANSIMTAQNSIGVRQCSQHYGLCTNIVKGEWGFQGFIETDMYNSTLQWQRDLMLRAGCDTWMVGEVTTSEDMSSPTAKQCIRNAVHNIAYTVINGSAMQGVAPGTIVHYAMSPWRVALLTVDTIVALIVMAAVALMIRRTLDERKNPEKYKSSEW